MSLARKVAITAFGNFIPPIAALATQPILAHSLGVEGRGAVAAAAAPLLLGIVVLALGVPESLTHFIARRSAMMRRTAGRSMAALVLSGAVGIALVAIFATPLSGNNREVSNLMLVGISALVPALIVTGLRGVAAGQQSWVLIAVERGSSALVRLISIAILAAAGALNVFTATIAISMTTFVGGFVYLLLIRGRGRWAITEGKLNAPPANFPVYAMQVWLGAAAGIMYSRLDQLLITPLASVYELGLYAIAASIAEVILLLNLAIRDVIFTVESESPSDSRGAQAARISTLLTLVFGAILAAISPWAVPFVFGPEFSGAVAPTIILIFACILGNPGSVAGAVLSGRGRPGLRSLSLGIGVAVNLVFVFLLVPRFGAVGAAFATLAASSFAGNNLNILWLRIAFRVRATDYILLRFADIRTVLVIFKRAIARRP